MGYNPCHTRGDLSSVSYMQIATHIPSITALRDYSCRLMHTSTIIQDSVTFTNSSEPAGAGAACPKVGGSRA
jgi:hypothetical protein